MTEAHGSYDLETDFLWLLHVVAQNIKSSVLVYLFWISSWSSICVCSWPSDQPVSAEDIMELLCCVVGRTEGSREDWTSFGRALIGVDAFGQMIRAWLCVLELKCANRWPTLVAGFTAHHQVYGGA